MLLNMGQEQKQRKKRQSHTDAYQNNQPVSTDHTLSTAYSIIQDLHRYIKSNKHGGKYLRVQPQEEWHEHTKQTVTVQIK